ncbi:hypothetical protein [Alloactinosynnema sp. L-07]|nr:hypothetical protein [Alloactinosynnema sp. L-07]
MTHPTGGFGLVVPRTASERAAADRIAEVSSTGSVCQD